MTRVLAIVLVIGVLNVLPASAAERVLFEDRFDGQLGEGWTWLRENSDTWRIKDGALEIRLEPGAAQNVRNALVRPAPDRKEGNYAIEVTVSNHVVPTQQYEQAGITWYVNEKPTFKLVKELVDGRLVIVPGHKPMDKKSVRLRLIVTADSWTAQYRPEGEEEFLTAESGKLPPPENDQVSIQGYHGPADAEHWVRFDDFRILALSE